MRFLILSLFLVSCGTAKFVSINTPKTPTPQKEYKVIAKAEISLSSTGKLLTLASKTINVTHTSKNVNAFALDMSSLVAGIEDDNDILSFGSFDISNLKVNNLNQCGNGSDPCTTAIVRIYTTDLAGFEGISGFINTTDGGYGIPVSANKIGALASNVGLSHLNAAIVDTYTIGSDKRLTESDFGTPTYEIDVNFTDAGVGDYEMNLVIEIAVN